MHAILSLDVHDADSILPHNHKKERFMLKKFSGRNYKAFSEFEVTLKPLTILLGANSCGKSALINSFLMLSQTLDATSFSESALRLNGNKVGMGEALNLIKDKKADTILSFSFDFDDDKELKKELDGLKRDSTEAHFMIVRYMTYLFRQNKDVYSKLQKSIDEIESIYVSNDRFNTNQLGSISDKFCALLKTYRNTKNELKRNRYAADPIQDFMDNTSLKKIRDCLTELLPISVNKYAANRIDYDFKYNSTSKNLAVKKITLTNKFNETISSIAFDGRNKISITSDIIDDTILRNSKKDIASLLNPDSFYIFNINHSRYAPFVFFNDSSNPVASFFCRMIHVSLKKLGNEFSGTNINHVSPLRAFPQRYYLLDKSIHHTQLNALDGTELAEVLKKNLSIRDEINKLLAEFSVAIDVEKVNDIIHKITVNQDAVNLELTDVGFGISQVLPILVQAYLSPENSITIIEQPEIHLHPKMQAWLTDALIKIALEGHKRFLIETHSEALVRRVRLRIVDEDSSLTEKDVAIYHLERNKIKGLTSLNIVPISSDGDITWPKDFMDVEIRDTLMIQQFKMQKSINSKKGTH